MHITHAGIYNAVSENQLNVAWQEKETAFGNYQTIFETSFLLNTRQFVLFLVLENSSPSLQQIRFKAGL